MEGLQKRHVTKEGKPDSKNSIGQGSAVGEEDDFEVSNRDDPKLSLMEELLIVVMDPRGFVSIWNDHVSRALRGCILIELWMRGKIELESAGMRKKCLSRRLLLVKNTAPTDDCILNEALKLIKDGPALPVADWISYLAGETWNPLKLKYHMRGVRDRLFKDLVERGILSTVKTNYWLLDVKSHPIKDFGVRKQLLAKVKDALLDHYSNDVRRIDKRTLSLLILVQYSGAIDDCLAGLPSDLERIAQRRIQELETADFEAESKKGNENDLHWAVYAALNDPYVVI